MSTIAHGSVARMVATARTLVANDKGLLAMDESTATCNARFAALGIAPTVGLRRAYREVLVTTPGLNESISGAILFDETIRQSTSDGVAFVDVLGRAGIIPGIKVDTGTVAMVGHDAERVTHGLDALSERLAEYVGLGARFAKWRAVFSIGDGTPSAACVGANAQSLARYAEVCQASGVVPIVEPEVVMAGSHTLERCAAVTASVLATVFGALVDHTVAFEAMLLKCNMVLPGSSCAVPASLEDVATATMECLSSCVPTSVTGVTFLSGGQPGALASARLNAMNQAGGHPVPWEVSFSFGRALQQPTLEIWRGREDRVAPAQAALVHRAQCNRAARRGEYNESLEAS